MELISKNTINSLDYNEFGTNKGIHGENFGFSKTKKSENLITEREILKPAKSLPKSLPKALSVRTFISVFGFEQNLLQFCGCQ